MSWLDEHRDEVFKKYTNEQLIKDTLSYRDGKGLLSKVLEHFFKECIFDCKSNRYKMTPTELLSNDELMKWVLEYIESKPTFYTYGYICNVEKYLWNSTRYARRVSNFQPKEARKIYNRYFNSPITILDTSCGFGGRMSAALLDGHNYIGFDPNLKLQDKLMECAKWYHSNGFIREGQRCLLYPCGSELFKSELVDTIDLSFTSPPYFNLESYSNDESNSTKNYDNYELWLKDYVKPTIENTYAYLKVGGYAMINIKNLTWGGKQPLFDDWFKIFDEMDGFEFVEVFDMKLNGARNFTQNCNYSAEDYKGFKEPIMCFKKVK